MRTFVFACVFVLATVVVAQEGPNLVPPSGVTDVPPLPRDGLTEPIYREPKAPPRDPFLEPEPADLPPRLEAPNKPLACLGRLYFDAPQGCVDKFGKFNNNPEASLKVMSVRITGGRTYIEVTANRDCLVFIGEKSSMRTDKMKLEVYTVDAGKPQVFALTKGEKAYAEMDGEFEYFAYENPFKKEEKGVIRHSVDGHGLFEGVPADKLPSVIIPQRPNGQRGPAWLDGTIEPLEEQPKREPRKQTPTRRLPPIAERPTRA
jgi:hypothetical protein